MKSIEIVDGRGSKNSYVTIARNKTTRLAVRPLITTRKATGRNGVELKDKYAYVLWFRVHLQNANGDKVVPTARVAKSWGIPGLYERVSYGYWRTDAYQQIAIQGECTPRYFKQKLREAADQLIDHVLENVSLQVDVPEDWDEVLNWIVEEHAKNTYGDTANKNTPALGKPKLAAEEVEV